jgi:DNA-binding transcriptional ArsR family regulator
VTGPTAVSPWAVAGGRGEPYHRLMPMTTETADVTAAVCLFRGLADPARLSIVRHLALGEHRVVDLTAHLGLAQSTVSGHLACLRDCGLVTARAEGRASLYSLARPELMDLLAAAERLLDATGDSVALCPVYGQDTGA